jgi:N-acetylmuramidase-like protein/peptidase M15-like protein
MHFRDDHNLWRGKLTLRIQPALQPIGADAGALQAAWESIGSLLNTLSARAEIMPAAALAVWNVESGTFPFLKGRPVLRLECHKLWEEWGQTDPERFDAHFQFGGHAGIAGLAWTNHRFRTKDGEWRNLHGSQQQEYEAFVLARRLAGFEIACRVSSFGGPQVMGFNHAKLGYSDAVSLYRAFGRGLRAQVLGFFDFCQSENLFPALKARDWHAFARVYNGPSRTDSYAEKINDAFILAEAIIASNQAALAAAEEKLAFDHQGFATFFATLGIKNFSAREFLFRGHDNSAPSSPAYGLNRFPPKELWPNIASVAKAADLFRNEIGAPVTLRSIYRTAAYNAAIGGAPESRHIAFAALDLQVKNGSAPAEWLDLMRRIRAQGAFTGAIGLHSNALHIDARQANVDLTLSHG